MLKYFDKKLIKLKLGNCLLSKIKPFKSPTELVLCICTLLYDYIAAL